jgi:hypothetical protein
MKTSPSNPYADSPEFVAFEGALEASSIEVWNDGRRKGPTLSVFSFDEEGNRISADDAGGFYDVHGRLITYTMACAAVVVSQQCTSVVNG